MLMDYNLWSPLSSSKNAIVIEHVFTDVVVVCPKLSLVCIGDGGNFFYDNKTLVQNHNTYEQVHVS